MERQWYNFFAKSSPQASALLSLVACIILAASGIMLGLTQDSLAVRTNGIVAAIDIVNSLVLVAAINRSIRSPDYIFNYGYGKYESLALLLSATLLLITFGFTVRQSWVDYRHGVVTQNYLALSIYTGLSLLFVHSIARMQSRRAKRYNMPMLNYDADVWRTDTLTELSVLSGLILGWVFFHFHHTAYARFADALSALVVLALALRIPLRHGRDAINQLLDRTLPDEVQFDILAVVSENISSFCEFKNVHTRQSGKDMFVEIDVVMPFDYTFDQAYPVEKTMQESIQKKYKNAITRIYAIPCPRDCIRDGKCYCPVKMKRDQDQAAAAQLPASE